MGSATWLEPKGVRALPRHRLAADIIAAGLVLPAEVGDAGNSIYQAEKYNLSQGRVLPF